MYTEAIMQAFVLSFTSFVINAVLAIDIGAYTFTESIATFCPPAPHVYYHTVESVWTPSELKGTEWNVVAYTYSHDQNLGVDYPVWDLTIEYVKILSSQDDTVIHWGLLGGDDGDMYHPDELESIAAAGGLPQQ
jgi:hypothetical protein